MNRDPNVSTEPDRDEGVALILALVMIILAALIVIPALNYTMTVTQNGRSVQNKVLRSEAVKGGLRTVLANGKGLYQACKSSGLTTAVTLASPGLDVAVTTKCTTTNDTLAQDPGSLWLAGASTWVGSVLPSGMSGTMYAGSGQANPNAWFSVDSTPTATGNKVWAPLLPATPLDLRSTTPYNMPSAYGACKVFFPGKYTDPLTLTANSNYYFVSGVYYFENVIRISGDAKVVVGLGATEGCADDLDSVSYADYSAPFNHNQSGAGATFVFGGAGRLVVDNVTASTSTGPSLTFNKRLVAPTETGVKSSENVSIMSVNGTLSGTTIGDLNQPQIFVPAATVSTTPPSLASGSTLKPSTLVPTVAPAPPALPIVDINLSGAATTNVDIESYIATPQGTVSVIDATGATVGKTVKLVGGLLAAQINVSVDRPATFAMGLVNQVVQKTFKIVSTTVSDNPKLSATAVVKVNDTGDYAIGSYVVETI
ncbi:MAG: hypothetical protein JJD93_07960 [Ilumatobacteraceae bacterium]|nr:hypothetical protein [Ilumatobacteraceae bacterium]